MAGPLLLGGAVHRRHLRVVRAQGGAAPHHGARHHHADGAALARARHRGHRDLQHDVRHPRRRHGHESGKCSHPACRAVWFRRRVVNNPPDADLFSCAVLPWMQVGELAGLAVGSAVCITSIFAG